MIRDDKCWLLELVLKIDFRMFISETDDSQAGLIIYKKSADYKVFRQC